MGGGGGGGWFDSRAGGGIFTCYNYFTLRYDPMIVADDRRGAMMARRNNDVVPIFGMVVGGFLRILRFAFTLSDVKGPFTCTLKILSFI